MLIDNGFNITQYYGRMGAGGPAFLQDVFRKVGIDPYSFKSISTDTDQFNP